MAGQQILDSLLMEFNALQVREILLAREGLKVSRTLVQPEYLAMICALLEKMGLYIAIHDKKYIYETDAGKGGWVSRYGFEESLEANHGACMIYVGIRPEDVLAAKNYEHSQNDCGLGESLGIPGCCVKMYIDSIERAEQKQNDYLEFTLANTRSEYPHNHWNNIAAQYFGYGLLSHYPCSFDCIPSADLAQKIHQILADYSRKFADMFLRYHQKNYIYTEFDGIFCLSGSTFEGGSIYYDPSKIEVTLDSVLASVLRSGNHIRVKGKHHFQVLNEKAQQVAEFEHPDISLLIFD
jgi:hypothetical protein